MADKGSSLHDTLRDVIGETVSSPASTPVSETKEVLSVATEPQTNAGDSGKEYVSGIDISDIPVNERANFKSKFEAKAKLLESGYNKKFQEVAGYAKEKKDLENLGLTVEEARDVLRGYVQSKTNPVKANEAKKESLRTLDKLIESAPLDQQSALEQMRQIILEETDISSIKNDMAEMKKFIHGQNIELGNKRQSQLSEELNSLKATYGSEVIEKYQDEVLKQGMNYNSSAKRLLHAIADPDELEQSFVRVKTPENKKISQDKLNAISPTNSGITGSHENLDVKKMSIKQLFRELTAAK